MPALFEEDRQRGGERKKNPVKNLARTAAKTSPTIYSMTFTRTRPESQKKTTAKTFANKFTTTRPDSESHVRRTFVKSSAKTPAKTSVDSSPQTSVKKSPMTYAKTSAKTSFKSSPQTFTKSSPKISAKTCVKTFAKTSAMTSTKTFVQSSLTNSGESSPNTSAMKSAKTSAKTLTPVRGNTKVKFADTTRDGDEVEEYIVPVKKRKTSMPADARAGPAPKQPELFPVGDMVVEAIRGEVGFD